MQLLEAGTGDLSAADLRTIRQLMDDAFAGDFDDEDLEHALGGRHWLLTLDGRLIAHASVVERSIAVDGERLRTGYVEAVATAPDLQRHGYGTQVMEPATSYVRERFELGCLGTGEWAFYERLGWERWRGPSYVRLRSGVLQRSPDDDDGIMILRTPATPPIDVASPIACDWRPGDSW